MSDVRNLVEQAADALARASVPISQAASTTAEAGAGAAAQGLQLTQAVASTLAGVLRGLPDQLRELELPSARKRLQDISDQLQKLAQRLKHLGQLLNGAGTRLGEPALQRSGSLVANGMAVVARGLELMRPNELGLFRFVPGAIAKPYADGVGTLRLGARAASDLTQMLVSSLPSLSGGLREIAEDLGRAGELLEATANTLRELSELSPI